MTPQRRTRTAAAALVWIGPALALIAAVVVFPACYMVWTSTRTVSHYGRDLGPAGLANFRALLRIDGIGQVFAHTAIWVTTVVAATLVCSLALAQFLSKDFPGRKAIRIAILVPWAASVVMTTTVVYYLLDPNVGLVNRFLVDVGLLDHGYGFTKQPLPAFACAIGVAVFVSIPFTTYTILAGLNAIPADVLEAAAIDGASPWQRYRHVVLPQLRPAIGVATIINLINVFNSLPILRVLAGDIPDTSTDTTTTLTFALIQQDQQLDVAAALSVLNFLLIATVIAGYVRVARPLDQADS
ncbi:MAG: sugar ABC transporter permease [Mycobacteriaceae bacterium]|nr:sugar ABC transporter permease [Mycobacteriaceae bacterium]